MKLSVIGAGYVGLTTAACLAQIGHDVFCSESDLAKLEKLQNGGMPLFEPHLEEIVNATRKAGRLCFGSTEEAIAWGEAIFICVGTPPLASGDADLSAIEGVARAIAKRATGYRLVIEKSTVPVQTGAQLRKHLSVHSTNGLKYDVASNPEFLREGSSVEDFLHPDRIVIGVDSRQAETMLRQIYEPIMKQRFTCPIHEECPKRKEPIFLATDTNSAELIKHASNSFLAMKISFINMVANLCEVVGADVTEVAKGMGLDPRIGAAFLNPGIGFGGFCFPKDVQAFIRDFSLLKEVEKINQNRISRFIEKLRSELWVLRGKRVAVWGLAFKPNTDDVRFAPSTEIIKVLVADGMEVRAYDPEAMDKAKAVLPNITYCGDAYQAAQGAEAVLLLTEWEEFRRIDFSRLATIVERPLIIDGRNALAAEEVASCGFEYIGIGGVSASPQMVPARNEAQFVELTLKVHGSPNVPSAEMDNRE
jgi:UDPglucose 6-dehydrogenase